MAAVDPLALQLDVSIRDNVAKMMEEANTRYGSRIRVNQAQRTANQAQAFHVLHMYLHNYFRHLKPKFVSADGRTISWEHLKDPQIKWALIDDLKIMEFLRTPGGGPVSLKNNGSWVVEPDKAASTKAMADYLKRHHVSSMAAPGVEGCGEPCLCGGHASKHLTGKACDLNGLQELGVKILAKESGKYASPEDAVDHFLAGFHLCRPLAHLQGKAQELWHVEALPPHHSKSSHQNHAVHTQHHTGRGCWL